MQPQVIYVRASESNPNTSELDEICRKMTEAGFELLQVSPSQGEGGETVGMWLFFLAVAEEPQTPAYWWHEVRAKKGLGLSLTLTGVTAMLIGSILHFALRNNIIDTTLHLGYFFGLVGLILFLIGLVILF